MLTLTLTLTLTLSLSLTLTTDPDPDPNPNPNPNPNQARQLPAPCTGYAFVVFQRMRDAARCVRHVELLTAGCLLLTTCYLLLPTTYY